VDLAGLDGDERCEIFDVLAQQRGEVTDGLGSSRSWGCAPRLERHGCPIDGVVHTDRVADSAETSSRDR